mgnify:FL=1
MKIFGIVSSMETYLWQHDNLRLAKKQLSKIIFQLSYSHIVAPSRGPALNINSFAIDDAVCEDQPDRRIVTVYWKVSCISAL